MTIIGNTNVPPQYVSYVNQAAAATGLPASVVAAQINNESGFNPNAVSPAGAQGIAQFEPGTFSSYGSGSPFNASDSFKAYSNYMKALLKQFGGNIQNALAAYNAGPGNIGAGMGYARTILSNAGVSSGARAGPGKKVTSVIKTKVATLFGKKTTPPAAAAAAKLDAHQLHVAHVQHLAAITSPSGKKTTTPAAAAPAASGVSRISRPGAPGTAATRAPTPAAAATTAALDAHQQHLAHVAHVQHVAAVTSSSGKKK